MKSGNQIFGQLSSLNTTQVRPHSLLHIHLLNIRLFASDGKSVMAASENEEKKKVSLSFQTKVVGAGGAAKPVAIRTNQMKDSTKHFFTAVAGTVYCNKVLVY